MKVILIEEKDITTLLERLKLEKFQSQQEKRIDGVTDTQIAQMHRLFHYHVVTWLQEQGASCSGR